MEVQLSQLKPGMIGLVVSIAGGQGLRQKLALRGIREGSWVRVISSLRGPVVVECRENPRSSGNVVALGRGIAQKITVRVGW